MTDHEDHDRAVIVPQQLHRIAQGGVKQHEAVPVFTLTQEKTNSDLPSLS
jgi:hypothetical protein